MRKSITYLILAVALVFTVVAAVLLLVRRAPDLSVEGVLALYEEDGSYANLTIQYPLNETLFPPEIVAPTFRWEDDGADAWLVTITFQDDTNPVTLTTEEPKWTPDPNQWETIKRQSLEKDAEVMVLGVSRTRSTNICSAGYVTIRTSKDKVDAPLFYREVNLPFIDAVKDPSKIRWRFGAVSSPQQPPIILQNLPVCGNCHSFSREGETLAMDVDYANSKGSYVITRTAEDMVLATSDIITWNDYEKEDGEQTFGLLSQVSPDGRYVVSTVKDKSVFVPMPPLAFSQLFFPIKGILCIYDRQTRTFESLPGADDPHYVQSNPAWSADGKTIVFARAKAYDLEDTKGKGKVLLTREECKEFTEDGKLFLFDLYRIPFNDGKGGTPEPIKGASHNGKSNYFAKYSPDGKWLVFCKAKSYMLLQPDSELHIIPAEGGEARRLRGNTSRMNSWHSWSPNSKWLAFSSKAHSPYTQLFLTHIDAQGYSSPAVLLEQFTSPDRAANIPEFVNTMPTAIRKIREDFLNDYSFVRAGNEFFKAGDTDNAIQEYQKALELNPNNAEARLKLGFLFYNARQEHQEGMAHYRKALQLNPNDPRIHHDLGMALFHQRQFDQAVEHLSKALEGMPNGLNLQYTAVNMRQHLGQALFYAGKTKEAVRYFSEAIRLDPNCAEAHYSLATTLAVLGDLAQALPHYKKAVELKPTVDRSPVFHYLLGRKYAEARRFHDAVVSTKNALYLARASGDEEFARTINKDLERYRQLDNAPQK